MNHNKKRLVKNGIIIPIIIAVILTLLFFAVLHSFSDEFPFVNNTVSISDYEQAQIIEAQPLELSGNIISKKDIPQIADNTVIGSIDTTDSSIPIIYNSNEVNAVGRMNISKNSKLFGEVGSVFASCYKGNSDFLKSLSVGDKLAVNTYYGSFVYEVAEINIIDDYSLVNKQGDGIGRALVLCTDNSDEIGISEEYLTVTCTMTSGMQITE
ncbi:MAG: hypothetical protein J1E36_08640 [Eubacterium sp.]|nr:hypothetical protein [Eubacterium sp.]